MAIQVWDGTKYVGAELGRFGPTGTLKEALIWDGTKYVKVWPSSAYPASGSRAWPLPVTAQDPLFIWANHVVTEPAQFTITATVTSAPLHLSSIILNGDRDNPIGVGASEGAATATAIANLAVGDLVEFASYSFTGASAPATGSWSITKN